MKDNTIKLFMWGFQRHMQHTFDFTAKALFNKIDIKLNPRVFLLGLLVTDTDDRHPICLEPEECGFKPEQFLGVKKLAMELELVDKEGRMFHTHPLAEEHHRMRLTAKSFVEAVKKILVRESRNDKEEYFVAFATTVGDYVVHTILALDKDSLQQHYSLTKRKLDRLTVYPSFIESTINIFCKECSMALLQPDYATGAIERNTDELLRDAGRQFMYTISSAGKNFEGFHGLYDACNEIASMKYEGAIGLGSMIIAQKGHKNVKLTLELENPINMRDYRMVRKFLEISDSGSAIICDSALIYGLGELRGKYNPTEENLFVINFTSHFKWEILHDNNALMEVEYRQPNLPTDRINREKFYTDFPRVFPGITDNQIDDLWDIAMEAINQKHGTMLVISDQAKTEATRLGGQSFPLKPQKLSREMIHKVTSIDGAVLLDRKANCHAIGLILDGLATEKGDPSRGARYNSAIRYYQQFGTHGGLMLIIISEDGMINLVPDLLPQIDHQILTINIGEFKELAKDDELDYQKFNLMVGMFKNLNFYLNESECQEINAIRKEIEEKFAADLTLRVKEEDLVPNPEMNDSYYK